MSMDRWTNYSLQGDDLIIPFDGGEIRFSRLIPPNPAGLRAFPLQRATDAEPTNDEGKSLQRGPILLEDGCLRVGVSNSMFTSYVIAVSYTHLDVYKRQRLPCAVRKKGRTGVSKDDHPKS